MGNSHRDFDGGNLREPVQSFDFLHSESAHAGQHDGTSITSTVRFGGHATENGQAFDKNNRKSDFPSRFLSHKGKGHP